ncbi:MAG: hypothetical protein CL846_09530 [Crocinitomicaceae bacterium]|nr:hypothetical protein [Crocinitomicaceae bacterium]|tara:strand:- start:2666 stop:3214 length:549 start_codon:yes stop_codon:yes gene_type:complete
MKYKGNKISFSILVFLLFVSCLSSEKVDSEIQNKENVESANSDTSVSINDLYFIEGNWLDTTQNVINKSYYDTWQIVKDSIFGKSTLLKTISPGVFDTIYNESMSMIEVDDRVMYVIRSSNKPLLAYPSFKKLGDSLIFKNMAESPQEVIFINESKDHFKLLLRGLNDGFKRETIYNYYREN